MITPAVKFPVLGPGQNYVAWTAPRRIHSNETLACPLPSGDCPERGEKFGRLPKISLLSTKRGSCKLSLKRFVKIFLGVKFPVILHHPLGFKFTTFPPLLALYFILGFTCPPTFPLSSCSAFPLTLFALSPSSLTTTSLSFSTLRLHHR